MDVDEKRDEMGKLGSNLGYLARCSRAFCGTESYIQWNKTGKKQAAE